MSQYKELADRLEAGTLFPAQWNKLVAILRSLDVQEPVAKVECLGTYYGKPFLGCVLGEGKAREGDSLYAAPVAAQPQQAKPMSEEWRARIVRANKKYHDSDEVDPYGVIDDVEADHGIKD